METIFKRFDTDMVNVELGKEVPKDLIEEVQKFENIAMEVPDYLKEELKQFNSKPTAVKGSMYIQLVGNSPIQKFHEFTQKITIAYLSGGEIWYAQMPIDDLKAVLIREAGIRIIE